MKYNYIIIFILINLLLINKCQNTEAEAEIEGENEETEDYIILESEDNENLLSNENVENDDINQENDNNEELTEVIDNPQETDNENNNINNNEEIIHEINIDNKESQINNENNQVKDDHIIHEENHDQVNNDHINNDQVKEDNIIHEENHMKHTEHMTFEEEQKIGKFNKLKILFEKYMIAFHLDVLKFLPLPYDYLLMFILGYYFMKLLTCCKRSIKINKKKKKTDFDFTRVDYKLKEILKLQEKMKNPEDNKEEVKKQNIDNLIKGPNENVDLKKIESIFGKLNEIKNDLINRNNENSEERKLQNSICDLQMNILEKTGYGDDGEEDEEDEDNKENK